MARSSVFVIFLKPLLILASVSPRRRRLLADAGFEFRVVSPAVAEISARAFTIRELTTCNATRKGLTVARTMEHSIVLAADTLVALDGQVLGKPANLLEAEKTLLRLSGRVHEVCSAVFIAHLQCGRTCSFCVLSRVRFRKLSRAMINAYLAKVNPLDKAGAYAAQGHGSEIIASVEGSFTNVVGLPLEQTLRALRRFGIEPARIPPRD